jgi:hypothetical protein
MVKTQRVQKRAMGVKLASGWRALVVALTCVLLGQTMTAAQPAASEAVVVATTAPGIEVGRVVRAGDLLDIPAGATVTLLEQTGAFATLTASGAYAPGEAAPSRARGFDAGRLVSAVATLVRVDDNDVQMRPFRGGGGGGACAGVAAAGGIDTLPQLLRANCATAARRRLDLLVAAASPANLYLAEAKVEAAALVISAKANFEATLVCALESPNGERTVLALTPAAARPNVLTRFDAAAPQTGAGAVLACEATNPDGRRAEARRSL